MVFKALQGRKVKLSGGYEFIKDSVGGTVAQTGERAMLLVLDQPLDYGGRRFEHVVAQVQRNTRTLSGLLAEGRLDCHCLWVPQERFDPSRPLEVAWWRGRDALLSTVELTEAG